MSIPRTSPEYPPAADRVDALAQEIWRVVRSDGIGAPADDEAPSELDPPDG